MKSIRTYSLFSGRGKSAGGRISSKFMKNDSISKVHHDGLMNLGNWGQAMGPEPIGQTMGQGHGAPTKGQTMGQGAMVRTMGPGHGARDQGRDHWGGVRRGVGGVGGCGRSPCVSNCIRRLAAKQGRELPSTGAAWAQALSRANRSSNKNGNTARSIEKQGGDTLCKERIKCMVG